MVGGDNFVLFFVLSNPKIKKDLTARGKSWYNIYDNGSVLLYAGRQVLSFIFSLRANKCSFTESKLCAPPIGPKGPKPVLFQLPCPEDQITSSHDTPGSVAQGPAPGNYQLPAEARGFQLPGCAGGSGWGLRKTTKTLEGDPAGQGGEC